MLTTPPWLRLQSLRIRDWIFKCCDLTISLFFIKFHIFTSKLLLLLTFILDRLFASHSQSYQKCFSSLFNVILLKFICWVFEFPDFYFKFLFFVFGRFPPTHRLIDWVKSSIFLFPHSSVLLVQLKQNPTVNFI